MKSTSITKLSFVTSAALISLIAFGDAALAAGTATSTSGSRSSASSSGPSGSASASNNSSGGSNGGGGGGAASAGANGSSTSNARSSTSGTGTAQALAFGGSASTGNGWDTNATATHTARVGTLATAYATGPGGDPEAGEDPASANPGATQQPARGGFLSRLFRNRAPAEFNCSNSNVRLWSQIRQRSYKCGDQR